MYMYFSNVFLYVYLGQSAISLSLYMCLKGASPLKNKETKKHVLCNIKNRSKQKTEINNFVLKCPVCCSLSFISCYSMRNLIT